MTKPTYDELLLALCRLTRAADRWELRTTEDMVSRITEIGRAQRLIEQHDCQT